MTLLDAYGWTSAFTPVEETNLTLGRITSIHGFQYFVITSSGEISAEVAGRLLYGVMPDDLPKVGDWVQLIMYPDSGYIVNVLPRLNALSRKSPSGKSHQQVLAANVDCALVVQGLDRDFNPMRLDRYLVQLAACNINAVVVLNKADLVPDVSAYRESVAKLQHSVPIVFCSTRTGQGLDLLKENILASGKTFILIGSSGVGKSSLLNALMDEGIQQVKPTSESNQKGRHTTTSRDLFLLPNGALMIDTPGMREFGVTGGDDAATADMFPAIEELAENCKFSDCTHMNDAGCNVLAAVADGRLDRSVYDSYLKLQKEQRRFELNAEDRKRQNKQAGKISRQANLHRKKFK